VEELKILITINDETQFGSEKQNLVKNGKTGNVCFEKGTLWSNLNIIWAEKSTLRQFSKDLDCFDVIFYLF